jgi:hypothetical protein
MIEIPNTTLCCIDCLNYDLSIKAIKQCIQSCKFKNILFLTDKEHHLDNVDVIKIPSITTKEHYSRFVIKELNKHINTDFTLLIQWDGYIVNPYLWKNEFQDYDYIGAKWWWHNDGYNVGNGGFSLRSKRLLQTLSKNSISISDDSLKHGEDAFICRSIRKSLEIQHDIKFAPEIIADRFSHERSDPGHDTFGFHGLFNMWKYIKNIDELINFVSLLSPKTLNSMEAEELGLFYHALGQLKEAEIVYRKILEFYPNNTNVSELLDMVNKKILPQLV